MRIETQREMQAACRAIEFCYLCGNSLKAPDAGAVAVEHVLARAALDDSVTGADAWPVTLRTHALCDRDSKKPQDELLIAVQRAHTRPLSDVPESDRAIFRKAILLAEADTAGAVPAFDASKLIKAAWAQVRGMHAALYRCYLPSDTKRVVLAPVPGFNRLRDDSVESQLMREEWFSDRILLAATAAVSSDEWDGITAWGGQVRYRCIWRELPGASNRAACFWILDTPQALTWAEVTIGVPRPWRGIYRLHAIPSGASVLSDGAVDRLAAVQNREEERHLVRTMVRTAGRLP